MRNWALFITFFFYSSCAKLGIIPVPEYKIESSRKGTRVINAKGKLLGETPLYLTKREIEGSYEGKFAVLYLEKEGYLPRVLMFNVDESVAAKVNLELDKEKTTHQTAALYGIIDSLKEQLKQQHELIEEKKDLIANLNKKVSEKEKRGNVAREIASVAPHRDNVVVASPKVIIKSKTIFRDKKITQKFPVQKILTVQYLIIGGELEMAKKNLLELEVAYPDISEIYSILAYIEYRSGDFLKAKSYLNKSLKINKKDLLATRLKQYF